MESKYVLLIFFLFATVPISAQEKREYERAISLEDAPEKALYWIESSFPDVNKIKWYEEFNSGLQSFEAKFTWQGYKRSIEFDEYGALEDIESLISFREIPREARQRLIRYFQQHYEKYKVRRVQCQLSGKPGDVLIALKSNDSAGVSKRYEVEYYGKTEDENQLWEGLFSDSGQLISKRKVVVRSVDNLTY